jgi:hypothetical protein
MSQADYDLVREEIKAHLIGDRTESAAQLAWFLQAVWRMDPEAVSDAICDRRGDKGIDAIDVDDELGEITIFQSKHRKRADADQGDGDLKNLVGAAAYFKSPETVDGLLRSKPNEELTKLIHRLEIRQKVAEGAHAARLVFVTNGVLDPSGVDYVKTLEGHEPSLEVWDLPRIAPVARRTKEPELRADKVVLHAAAAPTSIGVNGAAELAVALVPAKELVALKGIGDLTLFDRNVRLSVGRTRINRDLEKTVTMAGEHPLFAAYHNGLTVLTHELKVVGNELRLNGITVVNGCQSLLTLYRNQASITDSLNVLVKVVQVDLHSNLPDLITYRTNNQNSVDIRDQRSTDSIQRNLQAEVADVFGKDFGFLVRRGETVAAKEVLSNEEAAQLITAVYLKEPWKAVRKLVLFDDDYRRIFNRTIDAHKLYLLDLLSGVIDETRGRLRKDLQASFASVRLSLAHLVAEVLRESERGRDLLEDAARWLRDLRDAGRSALTALASDVAVSVNGHIETEEAVRQEKGELFDPKVAFKSQSAVRAVAGTVVQSARVLARRDPPYFFEVEPVR